MPVPQEIGAYYATGAEGDRLELGYFQLERRRTEQILIAHLPSSPAKILDVGGATGPYARMLTARGHEVHLLDPIPVHVEAASRPDPAGVALASAAIGDARELPWDDGEADAVLLLGPLYHLPDPADRRQAIAEARRVLRPGGLLFAAGISRLAVPLDGIIGAPAGRPERPLPLRQGLSLVSQVMRSGHFANPTGDFSLFTTSYMHFPAQLGREIAAGGFSSCSVHAVEGPGAWLPGFDRVWRSARGREMLCGLAHATSRVPFARALTPHLLVVAERPA